MLQNLFLIYNHWSAKKIKNSVVYKSWDSYQHKISWFAESIKLLTVTNAKKHCMKWVCPIFENQISMYRIIKKKVKRKSKIASDEDKYVKYIHTVFESVFEEDFSECGAKNG